MVVQGVDDGVADRLVEADWEMISDGVHAEDGGAFG